MMTAQEYVLVAYSIWIGTFVIYIYINKKRIKNLNQTISEFEKRTSVSTNNKMPLEKNESKK